MSNPPDGGIRKDTMYSKTLIIGNLGRDPEMKYLPSGDPVTTFSVATSEKWTGKDGQKQERTTWYRVSTFGKSAEHCNEYLKKGSKVYVEGQLTCDPETGGPRIWTDKEGNARTSFELRAGQVKFLSSKGEGGALPAERADGPTTDIEFGDDIPF